MGSVWAMLLGAFALTAPALGVRLSGVQLASAPLEALLFGLGVLGAAFLLAWAAEVAQVEISQGLALAVLALIAVLPEYAVDVYFAWTAAENPAYVSYATANMTGANRLLVGFAWPLVIVVAWLRSRRSTVVLDASQSVAVAFLGLATLYSFLLPLKGSISVLDATILVGLFAAYSWRLARLEAVEPDLVGPARLVGSLPRLPRRLATLGLFAFSGGVIFLSAEPFAEGLVAAGATLGIDEFLLVQWLAPLASEAPEVIVACLFAWRLHAAAGLGTLVSSKVNQWTLLIGTLPVAFSLAGGRLQALPLDARQVEELFLTAAQSLFAVALLVSLRVSVAGAALLLGLFLLQLVVPDTRVPVALAYLLLAALALAQARSILPGVLRAGLLGAPSAEREGPAAPAPAARDRPPAQVR